MKLYLDLETTGLDANKHGVCEISAFFDSPEKELIFSEIIKPFKDDVIDPIAMEYNGVDFSNGLDPIVAMEKFVDFLSENRKSVEEKFQFVGFNHSFDRRFLKSFFAKCGWQEETFDAWFSPKEYDIDVFKIAKKKVKKELVENYKQTTLLKHFNIDIDMNLSKGLRDILATKELETILNNME